MFDWLNMGAHSFYVGLSYSVTLLGTVVAIIVSIMQRKCKQNELIRKYRREELMKQEQQNQQHSANNQEQEQEQEQEQDTQNA